MNGEIFQVRMITTAADIGRNPTIESEQDKKNYKETGKTSGLSVSYTPGSAVSVSGGKRQKPQTPPIPASQNRQASTQEKKDTISKSKEIPISREPL